MTGDAFADLLAASAHPRTPNNYQSHGFNTANEEDIMKTIANSTFGLVMLAALYAGSATANGAGDDAIYAKQQGFLHDVRQAQLAHVMQRGDRTTAVPGSVDATQTFGHAGGVLNDIWQSQFAAYAGHVSGNPPVERSGIAGPRDFLTDVRRSQFRDSDV